ncbi:hypothetical protein CDAR_4501 [Caerostris darwini]|uniref:Uncharacterized protein n=1 Tax=Caerostris darwini TaxID=1538125 RepID=A0AAV4SML5_9ARAC|nr:hypothetical protein CDAR_4501 [Caerostris darwini]
MRNWYDESSGSYTGELNDLDPPTKGLGECVQLRNTRSHCTASRCSLLSVVNSLASLGYKEYRKFRRVLFMGRVLFRTLPSQKVFHHGHPECSFNPLVLTACRDNQ